MDEKPQPVWSARHDGEVAAAEAVPTQPLRSTFAEPVEPRAKVEAEPREVQEKVPFYKKVLAHDHEKDSGGFGPNWSNVDDYDIPTVLRKSMD